jgi:choline-glycine betaine transporter
MGEELTVEVIKQLPLAVVAIIACIALWRKLNKLTDELFLFMQKQLDNERESNEKHLQEVRARLMVVEDNLHIKRADRNIYLPTVKMPTSPEVKDLD